MVESKADDIKRPVTYARFRDDKPAQPGHTQELVAIKSDPKYFDNYEAMPLEDPENDTLLKHFKKRAKNSG